MRKLDHPECQTEQSIFPELGQHLHSRELIWQTISDTAALKFRRMGSPSTRLSSDDLLLSQASNAWTVGASVDDVFTLYTVGGMVRTVGSTANALSLEMVRAY
jgi:hypothetical protein